MSERILIAFYGEKGTGEIQRLVMACEAAYNNLGKRSFFGRDKGAEAVDKMNMALVRVIFALDEVGKTDKNNAKQSLTEVNKAMEWARKAWPNWPKAYKYWDDFYADICEKPAAIPASPHSNQPPIAVGVRPRRPDTESVFGSMGDGTASAESRVSKELREATVCAVIGCNAPIPAGRIVCPKHG